MNLKRAVIVSVMLHIGIMVFKPPMGWMASKEARALEVTYSMQSPVQRAVLQTPKPEAPTPKFPSVQTSSNEQQPVVKPAPVAEQPKRIIEPAIQEPEMKQPEVSVSASSASSLPEEEFDVVQHKQQVRRYLKKTLSYPASSVQGSVHLALTLDAQGNLKDLAILNASDQNLSTLTIEEIQRAQPYPSFPSGMKSSQVRYEFVIQYQQQ